MEPLGRTGSLPDRRLRKKKESVRSGKTAFSIDAGLKKTAEPVVSSAGVELDGSETVDGLLDDVHEAGDALKRDPVLGPLNAYKKAVRRFLRYIIDHSIEVEESSGIRRPGALQQKKYVVIKIADSRLESLAAHVLKGQTDQLETLRRIDEIYGMLVDLTG